MTANVRSDVNVAQLFLKEFDSREDWPFRTAGTESWRARRDFFFQRRLGICPHIFQPGRFIAEGLALDTGITILAEIVNEPLGDYVCCIFSRER